MNKQAGDVLLSLSRQPFVNQRTLSQQTGFSLGTVNRTLKELIAEGYLTEDCALTKRGAAELQRHTPRNAIILAAGYGMRMVPINMETPKAFLEVDGEPLIERLIRQLREAGISEIYVVVGFMKEAFEYLIDDFGVELVVNPAYSSKNNLHSLALAASHISNTYVIPSDIRCEENPFSRQEAYSWYMVSDVVDNDSDVRVNRKNELVRITGQQGGNEMLGIAYLTGQEAAQVSQSLREFDENPRWSNAFWEETLYRDGKMILQAKVVSASKAVEINTYEQLREIDEHSNQLKSDAIRAITEALHCQSGDICQVEMLKKGMTNRSFVFTCQGSRYIMRIPGEGTDKLINRYQEAAAYRAIQGQGLCDDPVYLDPDTGYKITRYIENVRACDPDSVCDLTACMEKLKSLHQRKLKVAHSFDLFAMIEFYESLWNGEKSAYRDYEKTKSRVLALKPFIDAHRCEPVLTHIDAVPDNFLFAPEAEGALTLQLTDWEYAGMQDPHVDIAMFCIYSLYNRRQVDRLISIYFGGEPDTATTAKIYCYIAVCGLLWSNWCEFKRILGVEFGEYSLRQYRYAKDYCTLAQPLMEEADNAGR